MNLSPHPFDAHLALYHFDGEICPMCEQAIPNDRLDQVRARQIQHQREVESQYALKAKAEREQLTAQLGQQNEEALAQARQEASAREVEIRAEVRRAAAAEADAKVAAATTAMEAARTQAESLKQQLQASAAETNEKVFAARADERRAASAEADAKVASANAAIEAARAQADQLKQQLEASAAATTEQVNAARAAARTEVEAALQPQLAAATSAAHQAQEQARLLTQREEAALAQVARLTQDVVAARAEGRAAADAELRAQLNAVNVAKQAAEAAKAAAEQQSQALRDGHDKSLRDAIAETRDALEKSHRDAVNAEQAKHFEDKQKFQSKLDELQRQLENKTALELGEGAEIDLFEALKKAFPGDDLTRIPRGIAGADIRHRVRHNGKECGLILYDSKNHKAWRNDFVTKLRDDQIAAQADHAILSTIAFPQGTRQLHIQDRVILVNPARAVVLAGIVRHQVVQAHCLKLSNDDREEKALALYSFITSERFGALTTKLHATTDSLSELDAKEQNAHKLIWQKRGQLIGSVVKTEADLRCEVDRIIGTANVAEDDDDLVALLADTAGTGA